MSQFSSAVAPQSLEQHVYSPSTGRSPNSASNALFDYFGPSVQTTPINAYDKMAFTNYDLPEIFRGKNLFLRDTIDGFILQDNGALIDHRT